MNTIDEIKNRMAKALKVSAIEVDDDSPKHAAHSAVKYTGGGHYQLRLVSPAFEGLGLIERHRMIYSALGNMMGTQVHALAIQALSETEWQKSRS